MLAVGAGRYERELVCVGLFGGVCSQSGAALWRLELGTVFFSRHVHGSLWGKHDSKSCSCWS